MYGFLIRNTIGLAFNMQRRTSVPYIFNYNKNKRLYLILG